MFNLTLFIFICEYDNFALNMNIFIYIHRYSGSQNDRLFNIVIYYFGKIKVQYSKFISVLAD